jgi:hypothetical protein
MGTYLDGRTSPTRCCAVHGGPSSTPVAINDMIAEFHFDAGNLTG